MPRGSVGDRLLLRAVGEGEESRDERHGPAGRREHLALGHAVEFVRDAREHGPHDEAERPEVVEDRDLGCSFREFPTRLQGKPQFSALGGIVLAYRGVYTYMLVGEQPLIQARANAHR